MTSLEEVSKEHLKALQVDRFNKYKDGMLGKTVVRHMQSNGFSDDFIFNALSGNNADRNFMAGLTLINTVPTENAIEQQELFLKENMGRTEREIIQIEQKADEVTEELESVDENLPEEESE